jgi:hypothetical protein
VKEVVASLCVDLHRFRFSKTRVRGLKNYTNGTYKTTSDNLIFE